ncbi:prolyl oligopeptidase family serine peptidase [Halorarum halobium]|uniref:prolyl oligopeptidase family serine peptidase n=1 Tax=Halorarum halobium TaxID=3075121 RepID=UPI0028ADC355|nr:prolyl oligopeptidase family serine peptidase [Halobaculum sp. XH14]
MPPSPPATERRPVTETLHGEEVTDPYRWLEEGSEAIEAWVEAQNEYADGFLGGDTAEALGPRFEELARVTDHGAVTARGGRYFQTVEGPEQDHGVLFVRESFDEEPRGLVDPNAFEAEAASMNWYVVGPDGDRVAYGYDEGGEEQYDVRVVDVGSGTVTEEIPGLGRVNPGGFAWTDDGFYYVATGDVGGGGQLEKALYYHEHGTDPDDDPFVTDAFGEHDWPQLEFDDESGTLLAAVHEGTANSEVFLVDVDAAESGDGSDGSDESTTGGSTMDGSALVPLITDADGTFRPHVHDGTVHFVTNYGAAFSRVLSVPAAEMAALAADGGDADAADDPETAGGGLLDPSALTETVPETDGVLQGIAFAGDRLLAHHMHDVSSELTVWADGEAVERIPTPEFCSVAGVSGDESGGDGETAGDGTTTVDDEVFYVESTFDAPSRVRRYDFGTGEAETLARADVSYEVDVAVSQEFFESTDGTAVPAFVVHREGLEPDGDAPTVLYGYGGFRIPQTPGFDRFRGPFLAAGGVFVVANLRGGSEYGEPWHEAGMRGRKQTVFDDFYAVAEGLIDAGYTNTDRLAAYGGSNGGLLTGAAVTQRPGLWGAVLSTVPLLDMLRFHRFLLGEYWTVEYGSPDDPDDFAYLREYSPYHNVAERAYPPTMFKTAAGDTRVHPGHARKMTALMQERNTGDAPVVLRTETDTGHGVGKPTEMIVREQVEQWTWLCDRLGVDVGQ